MCRLPRYLAAAVLGLTLLCAFHQQSARASADINACFDMVGDAIDTVAHAVDNVAAFAADPQCSAIAGSSTLMFGIVTAIVTAVNISGAFGGHDYDSCSSAINGAIASAIVGALSAALDDGSPLGAIIPDDARDPIKTIAVNLATDPAVLDQVNEWLSALPVIGQMIGMMPCACRLSAAVVQAATDIVETVKSAAECGEFLVNCIGSPIECAGSLFESGAEAIVDAVESGVEAVSDAADAVADFVACGILGDCPKPRPPPPVQVDCMGGATLAGDVQNYGDTGDFIKISVTSNQYCHCGGDLGWSNNNGVWSCGCTAGLVQRLPGKCLCPPGQTLQGGGGCKPCPEGSVEKNGRCDCQRENTELANIRGKLTCHCPPAFRDVAGQCVIPCFSPFGTARVRLSDGTCCDPKQVSNCGQCCRTPNCADERAPTAAVAGRCCPPGQIKVLGGCGRPSQITRAGYVCPLTMLLSDNGLDCSRPVRVMRNPPPSRTSAPLVAPHPSASPAGVPDCPPGQVLIDGRCGFPAAGVGTTTTQFGSPGVSNPDRSGGGRRRTNLDRFDLGPTFVSPDATTPGSKTSARGVASSKTKTKATISSDAVSPAPLPNVSAPTGGFSLSAPPPKPK